MSDRKLVIQYVTDRMIEAFAKGDVIDAQNMNAFVRSLEHMTDPEYAHLANEETLGAIS